MRENMSISIHPSNTPLVVTDSLNILPTSTTYSSPVPIFRAKYATVKTAAAARTMHINLSAKRPFVDFPSLPFPIFAFFALSFFFAVISLTFKCIVKRYCVLWVTANQTL